MENNTLDLLNALSSSRADDYQEWLEVGMALHAAGASCSDWDLWSRQSSKYNPRACEQKWGSFGHYTGSFIGIGTLAKMAKDDGYTYTKTEVIFSLDDYYTVGAPKPIIAKENELAKYLKAVFKPEDYFNCVVASYQHAEGKFLPANKGIVLKAEKAIDELNKFSFDCAIGSYDSDAGAWIRFNPVKSTSSGSKNDDILEYRHCLIESDTLDKAKQLEKIKALNLPCSAIVDSGGKSIHAIVKVDAGTDFELYKKRVAFLHNYLEKQGFPVDKACKNASRLSRMPSVMRGNQEQKLIAVNIGATSFVDWNDAIDDDFTLEKLSFSELFNTPKEDKSDNLLGDRFLTKEGSWLIVAQSGVGKSVLAMQMAISFALGRDLWGLKPIKPLKIALIQAENNKLDLVEPLQSICAYMELNHYDRSTLDKNFNIYPNSTECGSRFGKLLDRIGREFKPDIVIVDPLLSYIGGDISKQDVCSIFLRNTIHPIIKKHQMSFILLHHTSKPKNEDIAKRILSYAGAGSAELTNYVRAVSTLFTNADDENVFDFHFSKRGRRFDEMSVAPTIYLKQGEKGRICWINTDKPREVAKADKPRKKSIYDDLGIEHLEPMPYEIMKAKLRDIFTENNINCDEKALKKFWSNNRSSRSGGWLSYDKFSQKWEGKFYVES